MPKVTNRFWEIMPGLMTWATIVVLVVLAVVAPLWLSFIVFIYLIYWLVKILNISAFLVAGYARYLKDRKIDWYQKLKNDFPDRYGDYYHLVIVPTYKEDISILRHTLTYLHESNYDPKKIITVVAFEEREKELAPEYAKILPHEFEHKFGHFLITFHPSNIDGEVKGKGPNITWAARRTKEYLENKGIPLENVIVTTIDADNRVDRSYLANVAWAYCNDPDPLHKSFQPIPMFFNNIWKVPLLVKLTSIGSTFWQLIQGMRPYYARNFSAHAQGMAALVQTDYWSVETIVEDGHQYWRSYFAFKGNHYVVPIFTPVYMDAIQGHSFPDTMKEQYLQRRRWYWGVSDIPYVYAMSRKNSSIPFRHKWAQFARLVESHYSLATQTIYLSIGWLPILLHKDFQTNVFAHNFSTIYNNAFIIAWVGMIINMLIASLLIPPRPGKGTWYGITLIKEWVLAPVFLPLSGMLFGALPAIDSQTRLMIDKPFTVFNVSKKMAIPSGIVRESN